MKPLALCLLLLLTDCRFVGGRWVVEEERRCRGGVVTTEKRITDTFVMGRVRNTVIRTDACLD